MCSVSAVMDHGQRQWPNVQSPQWTTGFPIRQDITPSAERDAIRAFMELVKKAEEFDRVADQPHCEDPEKIKLLERIAQRLEVIEQHLGITA